LRRGRAEHLFLKSSGDEEKKQKNNPSDQNINLIENLNDSRSESFFLLESGCFIEKDDASGENTLFVGLEGYDAYGVKRTFTDCIAFIHQLELYLIESRLSDYLIFQDLIYLKD
jgi:hypothetical protein